MNDLENKVMDAMKTAMKGQDKIALESLRAIKSAILLAKTDGRADAVISDDEGLKIIQKLVKQRRDAAEIYTQQNRKDLAETENAQIRVLEQFLPEQLDAEQLEAEIKKIIEQTGANSPADLGRVMGAAGKILAGKAEGKTIAETVKKLLS